MLPAMMMNLSQLMRIMYLHQNHVRELVVALLRRRRKYTNSALMNPKMMTSFLLVIIVNKLLGLSVCATVFSGPLATSGEPTRLLKTYFWVMLVLISDKSVFEVYSNLIVKAK